MENQVLISIPLDQLLAEIARIVDDRTEQILKAQQPVNPQTFSFTKVGEMLKRKPETIKKLAEAGAIRCTDDGRITQAAINDYLKESS